MERQCECYIPHPYAVARIFQKEHKGDALEREMSLKRVHIHADRSLVSDVLSFLSQPSELALTGYDLDELILQTDIYFGHWYLQTDIIRPLALPVSGEAFEKVQERMRRFWEFSGLPIFEARLLFYGLHQDASAVLNDRSPVRACVLLDRESLPAEVVSRIEYLAEIFSPMIRLKWLPL